MSSASDPGTTRSATPRLLPARLPYGAYARRQFFDPNTPPIDPPAPEPKPTEPKPTDPPGDPADLGDKGKAAIERERTDRQAAEARAKAAEKELRELKADRQREADQQAEEQGRFKELAEKRLTELTAVTQDRDGLREKVEALEAEVTGYREAAQADYDAAFKALPKEVAEMEPEGDLAAKRAWLPKAQALAESLGGKRSPRGNPPTPRAAGPATQQDDADDDAARKRQIAQTKL